jgi:hypothetical protein
MIHNEADNIEKSILETLKEANTQGQIAKEKSSTREQVIAKLVALLAISFKRGTSIRAKGGLKAQQKWFSISASLAQTLARLVSDLEYENLRIEYEELKKLVLEGNVASQGIALPQTGLREPEKGSSQQQT